MAKCEKCGNEYDKAFQVVVEGTGHWFDSFECAIATLAPECTHCGTKIIGHGMEARGEFYCCAHCAHEAGITELQDRSEDHTADKVPSFT